jgi:UPF0271 protein
MRMEPDALRLAMRAQCGALRSTAERAGIAVTAVKPHGALYHHASANEAIAAEVVGGAIEALGAVLVVGPPRGALRDAALARGLPYAREGFADRRMRADGSLVPRSEADALITEPAAAAAQAVALDSDVICVHADTPGALAIARAVREALAQRHVGGA